MDTGKRNKLVPNTNAIAGDVLALIQGAKPAALPMPAVVDDEWRARTWIDTVEIADVCSVPRKVRAPDFFTALDRFALAHVRGRSTIDKRLTYRVAVSVHGRATRVVRVYYADGVLVANLEPARSITSFE